VRRSGKESKAEEAECTRRLKHGDWSERYVAVFTVAVVMVVSLRWQLRKSKCNAGTVDSGARAIEM
jgi:hypothetical protein